MRAHSRRFSFSKAVFKKISSRSLIYNTSWEDPEVDLSVLNIDHSSRVLMITGAGDNSLNYLLKSPASITTIDQNRYQTALLNIKAELIKRDEFDLLRSLFMQGRANLELLADLRKIVLEMPESINRLYQEKLVNMFTSGKSFYYRGSAGFVARLIKDKVISKKLVDRIGNLFDTDNLNDQKEIYLTEVEPYLFNRSLRRYLASDSILSLLGVPLSQLSSIKKKYEYGLYGFLKEKLRHVFTTIPAKENYFWQVYFYGSYIFNRPPYLLEENFNLLKSNISKLEILTGNIYETDFRQESQNMGDGFTHANLLDSLDWFSDKAQTKIAFPTIVSQIVDGAKILFRSSHFDMDHLIEEYSNHVTFETSTEGRLKESHQADRVGTYASLFLATKRREITF